MIGMTLLEAWTLSVFVFAVYSPRQTGRFVAKVVIGFRAQMRDEGEA